VAETFYGPWRIVQYQPYSSPYLRQSLVVARSDGADGRYLLEYFNPVDLTVQGAEWSLRVQYSDAAEGEDWHPITPRKQMTVLPETGLTLLLDIPFPSDGQSLAIQLICTCLDETINPPRRPNPYDFTYTPG
jgi:hypothetical protein